MVNNKIYDVLKWVAIIAMPALGLLYTSLAQAWGLPYSSEISTTVDAIGVFLGALLGVSTVKYNKEDK